MGIYLNPGAKSLQQARKDDVYVDKSELLAELNRVVDGRERFVCVSRPRRFGKTMAADMVCAYYDRTVDGMAEFAGLKIADDPSFDENRNRYDVLHINMVDFLAAEKDMGRLLDKLQKRVSREIARSRPECDLYPEDGLPDTMADAYAQTGTQFVVVIDEWDCVMRRDEIDEADQRLYLDFLRTWLKDRPYVALAYMTGILPVKKYGEHSALNMFTEISMLDPGWMAPYTGFTEDEVRSLCETHNVGFSGMREWYDGYRLRWPVEGEYVGDAATPPSRVMHAYCPSSVVQAIRRRRLGPYWNRTETFEALRRYVNMGLDGLRDKVVRLLAGERVKVDTGTYQNDLSSFTSADDVLTMLTHTGYLCFEDMSGEGVGEVYVPNKEVAGELRRSVVDSGWPEVARSISASEALTQALLDGDEAAVAEGIARAHEDVASVITYNNEADLAATLRLALYAASSRFRLVREAPAGKGFADLALVPLMSRPGPGAVVELKMGGTADDALAQIRSRDYAHALEGLATGGLVLCGIAYDRDAKTHTCKIVREER